MTPRGWAYAFSSAVGTAHVQNGSECQDAADCAVFRSGDQEVLVAAVSDGAGSASRGGAGAAITCSVVLQELAAFFECDGNLAGLDFGYFSSLLDCIQARIETEAAASELLPRDFAATLLVAIVGSESCAFFQIGDGAMVYSTRSEPDDYTCVFWPQRGEFENVTFFVTDPAAKENADHLVQDWRVDEIALFTDGLQRLTLRYADRMPHAPFFRPMFRPIREEGPGHSTRLSEAISDYLQSDGVNARTDDDKTLILATRLRKLPEE